MIVAGRRQSALDKTTAANPGMKSIVLDVEDKAAIASVAAQIKRDYPTLNVVIHNAGIARTESIQTGEVDDAEATIATNLLAPIRLTAVLLPLLEAQPHATIVMVSAALAFVPMAIAQP